MKNFEIDDLIKVLERSKEAEDILRDVLSYYNIYSGQFEKIPAYHCEYARDSLNSKIRSYIEFDDSE